MAGLARSGRIADLPPIPPPPDAMPTIQDPAARAALIARLGRVTPTTTSAWGTLTAPRMVCHLADQLRVAPLAAWWYAPLNVNLAPFDNLKARQALNYAVDRDALVSVFGGPALAQPVCTILPPDFPGHEDFCEYTLNPGPDWTAPDLSRYVCLRD